MSKLVFRGVATKVNKQESSLNLLRRAFHLATIDACNYGVQLEREGSFTYRFIQTGNSTECVLEWREAELCGICEVQPATNMGGLCDRCDHMSGELNRDGADYE